MTMADELQKLEGLHQRGALTDDEYQRAKARVLASMNEVSAVNKLQGLQRSLNDRWLGGVCGGLALATNIPTWAWRVLFILAILLNGLGILMYVLMWIFVPQEPIRIYLPAPATAVPAASTAAPSPANPE